MIRSSNIWSFALAAMLVSFSSSVTAGIRISWDDNSSNEKGFHIYRSTDGETFDKIASTGENENTFLDETVTASQPYWYRVTAYMYFVESEPSNTVEGHLALPPPVPSPAPPIRLEPLEPQAGHKISYLAREPTRDPGQPIDASFYESLNFYYTGAILSDSVYVPFVSRVAPNSITSHSSMALWLMESSPRLIAESISWSKERYYRHIDAVIRYTGMAEPVNGISEPAIFSNSSSGEFVSIFEALSGSSAIKMFEAIDVRSFVGSGLGITEIYAVGPLGSQGNGFSVSFRVNEGGGVWYDIVGVVPLIEALSESQVAVNPKVILYDSQWEVVGWGGSRVSSESEAVSLSALATSGNSRASVLRAQLEPGVYTAHVFGLDPVDLRALVGLSIRRY